MLDSTQYANMIGDLSCTNSRQNPRKMVFLQVKTPGVFKDPWGKDFQVALDTSYNEKIPGSILYGISFDANNDGDDSDSGEDYLGDVMIWSKGPDKADSSTDNDHSNLDNIYSVDTKWVAGKGHVIR